MSLNISARPSIQEIQQLYQSGQATVTQVTEYFLQRAKEKNQDLNSFYCFTENLALKQASRCEQKAKDLDNNWPKIFKLYPLFGIPYSVKAIIQVEGEIFNASSKIMDNFRAPYSSTVFEKIDQAGAILIGINNMDQWAMGSSGEFCDYGVTKNPFDLTRVPGGSSSGPAVAVASGQVVFSLGTDTGGSIRQPAAFCDVVGLKPTYGAVSRWGVMPMASSLDQVGAFTNNVEDNILVNALLYGKDSKDQTTIESQALKEKLGKLIGVEFSAVNQLELEALQKQSQKDGYDLIVCCLIVNPQGQIFVQKRKADRDRLPNCWDLVGGHVEADETILQALQREIKEETGWELDTIKNYLGFFDWQIDGRKKRDLHFIVTVKDYQNLQLETDKVSEYLWIDENNLELLTPSSHDPFPNYITDLVAKALNVYGDNQAILARTNKLNNGKFKIGLPQEFYVDGIDPQIRQALDDLRDELEKLGHEFVQVSLPVNNYALAVYYMTMSVEVASNLERIDGIRYANQQESYSELYFEHRGKYFGPEPKRRIMLGTFASSAGYYDAYYNQAQKVRELARRSYQEVFAEVDLLLVPTTPEFPFKIGDKTSDQDPVKMYLSDIFTCGINPVGIPGLNVPLGFFSISDQDKQVKLPTGCQVLGPELSEDKIYQLALEIEKLVSQRRQINFF